MLRDLKTAFLLVLTALGSALVLLFCAPIAVLLWTSPESPHEPDPVGDDPGVDVDAGDVN